LATGFVLPAMDPEMLVTTVTRIACRLLLGQIQHSKNPALRRVSVT
jgi:hypothetical protein